MDHELPIRHIYILPAEYFAKECSPLDRTTLSFRSVMSGSLSTGQGHGRGDSVDSSFTHQKDCGPYQMVLAQYSS